MTAKTHLPLVFVAVLLVAARIGAVPAAAQGNVIIKGKEDEAAAAATPSPETMSEWPCVQRKVENLSVGQVWDGPPIEGAKDWNKDKEIATLVNQLASRRLAIEQAEAELKKFAESQPADKRDERLTLVFAGLFDKVNTERRTVIHGIGRYQKSQKERAAELVREEDALFDLEQKAKTDEKAAKELADAQDKFTWASRIFQDRQGNIPIACELPTLIEERLYSVAHSIRSLMKS